MRYFLCTIILIFGLEASAQKMLWSTPQKMTNRNYYTHIMGSNVGGVYCYQTSKNNQYSNIQIVALEHNMKSKARQEFLVSSKQHLHAAALMENSISLFYSIFDRKAGTTHLYAKTLDLELNPVGNDKQISIVYSSTFRHQYFRIVTSRDQKQVLIATVAGPDSLNKSYKIKVLDEKLNTINQSVLSIDADHLKGKVDRLDRFVFIYGELHFLAHTKSRDGLFSKSQLKTMVKHTPATNTTSLHPLYNDNWNTLNGQSFFNPGDSSYIFSSYYYPDDSLSPVGFVQFVLPLNQDSSWIEKRVFPDEMMEDLFGKNAVRRPTKKLTLIKTLRRSDGGTIYITEKKEIDEQVIQEMSISGTPQTHTRYYYYFYDISILSVNPDGSIDWHKTVKKEQISLNDEGYFSSFGCQVSNNRIYFVFNDLSSKSSNLLLAEIKPNGKTNKEILINGNEFDGFAIPKESVQLSGSSILVPMIKSREGFTLLKLEF